MKLSLRELAVLLSVGDNPQTKLAAPVIYELYDDYFSALRDSPIVLLELGVAQGESLKTFASYFENGRIIGIDSEDRGLDFSSHPNVRFEVGDQRDAARLSEVCAAHAPDGLDIVHDENEEARHGNPGKRSFSLTSVWLGGDATMQITGQCNSQEGALSRLIDIRPPHP